jgi:hypothetical protein
MRDIVGRRFEIGTSPCQDLSHIQVSEIANRGTWDLAHVHKVWEAAAPRPALSESETRLKMDSSRSRTDCRKLYQIDSNLAQYK